MYSSNISTHEFLYILSVKFTKKITELLELNKLPKTRSSQEKIYIIKSNLVQAFEQLSFSTNDKELASLYLLLSSKISIGKNEDLHFVLKFFENSRKEDSK